MTVVVTVMMTVTRLINCDGDDDSLSRHPRSLLSGGGDGDGDGDIHPRHPRSLLSGGGDGDGDGGGDGDSDGDASN